ncbi:hypothetical protein ILYODFUR_029316 [Ilyodon furcidens]|uniref:Uncharacterized protein n=1 Tax=Ilyodon furcidens TaxID=33524 RepID=A0ABV0UNX0_9TELE
MRHRNVVRRGEADTGRQIQGFGRKRQSGGRNKVDVQRSEAREISNEGRAEQENPGGRNEIEISAQHIKPGQQVE